MTKDITVNTIDHHRNGVGGEDFYVVHFTDPTNESHAFMAVVFSPEAIKDGDRAGEPDWDIYERGDWDNPRIAVFQSDLLPDTRFGHNSWRGDNYAAALYKAIKDKEDQS